MPTPGNNIVIVSPALEIANNGNWQTAYRWSRFLAPRYKVSIVPDWRQGGDIPDVMIALHARKSAQSIANFAAAFPRRPLIVVLTGTDLYQDIRINADAKHSLDLATGLVVLQEQGVCELAPAHRKKCHVIYQSARKLKPFSAGPSHFVAVLVGHMRDVKDPLTPMRALGHTPASSKLRLIHIGNALEPKFRKAAETLEQNNPRYIWLRELSHAQTRQRIKRAQLMVISSLMEGGANVIIEAITSGVPVIASKVSGNIGMLGRDYVGYFPVGNSKTLAQLLDQAEHEPNFLKYLKQQCERRMVLFSPDRENDAVNALVDDSLDKRRPQ
ncbi:MAG: selenoneine biosynthesis selenosugar synthase SenB [Burkholderiales bacterium]